MASLFACHPVADPRVQLLKQVSATGLPARRPTSSTSRSSAAAARALVSRSGAERGSGPAQPPLPPSSSRDAADAAERPSEILSQALAVDVSLVYDDDDGDDDDGSASLRASTVEAPAMGEECGSGSCGDEAGSGDGEEYGYSESYAPSFNNFSRRAFVATGQYRVG